jgi:hypothetical protein
MKRENASFLLGGIFLGFILGAVFAHFLFQTPAPAAFQTTMPAPVNPSDPMGAGNNAAVGGAGALGGGAGTPGGGQMMQQIQEEMGSLKKALEANPKDAALLTRMGNLYYDAGMFDRARDYYIKSLESDPRNPNVSTDLGICYHRLGQADEALQRFRASLAIDPRHWQSWLNLGIVSLFEKQDVKTTEEAFARVKELNPAFQGLPQLQQALDRVKAGGKP